MSYLAITNRKRECVSVCVCVVCMGQTNDSAMYAHCVHKCANGLRLKSVEKFKLRQVEYFCIQCKCTKQTCRKSQIIADLGSPRLATGKVSQIFYGMVTICMSEQNTIVRGNFQDISNSMLKYFEYRISSSLYIS